MFGAMMSRVVLLTLVVAPLGIAVSAGPAAALTCSSGDVVLVKVKATPATVPSGSEVTVVNKGLNCTDATQEVSVVTKAFAPAPCGDGSGFTSTDSVTFAPHQLIRKTQTFVPAGCPGRYRYVIAAYQGSTRLSKSAAEFTAL
jgi:hypothetical protein